MRMDGAIRLIKEDQGSEAKDKAMFCTYLVNEYIWCRQVDAEVRVQISHASEEVNQTDGYVHLARMIVGLESVVR